MPRPSSVLTCASRFSATTGVADRFALFNPCQPISNINMFLVVQANMRDWTVLIPEEEEGVSHKAKATGLKPAATPGRYKPYVRRILGVV